MYRNNNMRAIEELAASEGGVFTSGQAARSGIPRYALSSAAKSGRAERIRHGAYRMAATGGSDDDLVAAYKLTAPGTFTHERMGAGFDGVAACGATAAHVLGIGDLHPHPWEIAVPKRFNSRMSGVRFRTMPLERDDVVWIGGLPVTRAERTIADLLAGHEEGSLVADALVGAIRRYGSTELDIGRLEGFIGPGRLGSLLASAGICAGGRWELVRVDGLGHVAVKERD